MLFVMSLRGSPKGSSVIPAKAGILNALSQELLEFTQIIVEFVILSETKDPIMLF